MPILLKIRFNLFFLIALLNSQKLDTMYKSKIGESFNPRIGEFETYESYFKTNSTLGTLHGLNPKLIKAIDEYPFIDLLKKNFNAKNNHLKKINLLIEQDANINLIDSEGNTILFLACYKGDYKTIKLLLNLKIEINKVNEYGFTALTDLIKHLNCTYCTSPNYIKIIKLLIAYGADYTAYDFKSDTRFLAWENYINKIRTIIKDKEKIIKEIHDTINTNNINKAKKLLLKGYKYFYDIDQNNILHIAAQKNKLDIFLLIFNVLPELINEKNKHDQTPIDLNQEILIHLIYKSKNNLNEPKLDNKIKEKTIVNKQKCILM